MFTTSEGFFTRVWYKNQVVVGEVIRHKEGYIAKDYRSVTELFTFKPLAVGWIISRAKKRRSREKVYDNGQSGKLKFFTWESRPQE